MAASRPVHGALNLAELDRLGLDPEDVTDFSASINPLGPSSRVLRAIRDVDPSAYPDPECLRLRQGLSRRLGLPEEAILVGNGSTELIHLLARSRLRKGLRASIFVPGFGEYAAACRLQEVEPYPIPPEEGRWFRWDMAGAANLIEELRPNLTFLCNPNNPTGVYLDRQEVEAVAEAVGNDGLLVVDEAYSAFVDRPWDTRRLLAHGNVVLLRSMTKDHAIPGVRLGYMLAPRTVIEDVQRFQSSWSVNAPAQAAGMAALQGVEHVAEARRVVRASRAYLLAELEALGLVCNDPSANFLLVDVGNAAAVRLELLQRYRLCVRDCTSFGMPRHIRVGIRSLEESHRLVQAVKEVCARHGTR